MFCHFLLLLFHDEGQGSLWHPCAVGPDQCHCGFLLISLLIHDPLQAEVIGNQVDEETQVRRNRRRQLDTLDNVVFQVADYVVLKFQQEIALTGVLERSIHSCIEHGSSTSGRLRP